MLANHRPTIGVLINQTDRYFQSEVGYAITTEAAKSGYDVAFFCTVGYRGSVNASDELERIKFDFATIELLDGIIVAPDTYQMTGFRETLMHALLTRAKSPVVFIRDHQADYDCVFTDENNALRLILRHLAHHHGLTDIRFMAGYHGHPDGELRLACYQDEMAKLGLDVNERSVFFGDMWKHKAEEAYQFFFSDAASRPQAIVCANDHMALSLCDVVLRNGLRVPEDVIITGFDNIDESKHCVPSMTTIGQDYRAIATEAVAQLLRRIDERRRGIVDKTARHISMPAQLYLRESCGCTHAAREDYRDISLLHLRELRDFKNRQISQTYFSIGINGCDTFDEIHDTLVSKINDIPEYSDFYLCLFENPPQTGNEVTGDFASHISDTACLLMGMKDRKDIGMPRISFDRRMLLPPEALEDRPCAYHFLLLHQRECNYGFTVFRYQDGESPSVFYHNWNVTIANALRHINNLQIMSKLYEERRLSSIQDPLTGLSNRRALEERLSPVWSRMCEEGETVAFIGADMDCLKKINDSFGHAEGDFALCGIGKVLIEAARPDGLAARIGGDEFLLFLPHCDQQQADERVQQLYRLLQQYSKASSKPYAIAASLGAYARRLQPGDTVAGCMHQCDMNLYQEKKRRKAER